MGAGSVPRVGTAAWTAARLAWRDRATASARALIAARRAAAGAPPLTDALDAGVHATPAHRSSMSPSDCWPRARRNRARGWHRDTSSTTRSTRATCPSSSRRRRRPCTLCARRTGRRRRRRWVARARDARPRRARRDAPDATGDDGDRASGRSRRPPRRPRRPRRRTTERRVPTRGGHGPTLRPRRRDLHPHRPRRDVRHVRYAKSTPIDAHGYWSPHVDKANVPEYDVSAVLYLSGDGVDFAGGALHFMDASGGWKTVTPRRNRLVVFSSGRRTSTPWGWVTSGERTTLNLWLTRDPRVAAAEDVVDDFSRLNF